MHGVAGPDDIGPFGLHRLDQTRQVVANLASPKARDQGQAARFVLRVQLGHQQFQVIRRGGRAAFQPDRVQHAAREFDMRAVGLAGAVADPDHVTGPGHVLTGDRIHPCQGLFILQQQRLVAGIEIDGRQRVRGIRVYPGRIHEIQRVRDAVRNLAVAFRLVMLGKAQRPGMHPVDISETTC